MTRTPSWKLDTPTRRARLVRILFEEAVKRESAAPNQGAAVRAEAPFETFLRILDDLGLYVALEALNRQPREWPTDTLDGVPIERITRVRTEEPGAPSGREADHVDLPNEGTALPSATRPRPAR